MTKDLTLAMDVKKQINANLPLGTDAHGIYQMLCDKGYGSLDFSVIFDYLYNGEKKI